MFTVESNIPMPVRIGGIGAPSRYPFASMVVGDSFYVAPNVAVKQAVRVSAYRRGKALGFAFTVRKDGEGTRVWRIR